MTDTLNFGPEWLRALSDGNNVGTPPPSPGIPGKYKLADYRYGREEMLALNNPNSTDPSEELKKLTYIYVEKAQQPLSMQSLTEEEQRLMSQSVNSTAVLRMFGRGGPPGVRGRGGIERGRGRGRGRGEGFLQRGISAEEGGGFGRPPSHSRSDGWEEVGAKRNYQSRYEDGAANPRQFQRSLSNENWRDRGGDEEEEDGDWRRAGSKWNTRGNWREPINRMERGGFDSERHHINGTQRGGFDKPRQYQRNRISESWDEEDNLPEWSMPDTEGNDVGTFDSSGAFVSTKKKPGDRGKENNDIKDSSPTNEKKDSDKNKSPVKQKVDTKEKVENKDKVKTSPPRVKQEEQQKENEVKKEIVPEKKVENKGEKRISKPAGFTNKPKETEISKEVKSSPENNSAPNNDNKNEPVIRKNEETNVSLKKDAAEAETLARLQEAAENVVLSAMTAEDDEKEKQNTKEVTALPTDHADAHKWFYKDPQGDMQGPFTSNEMAEWFSAGYFTMNLQVKRGCDEKISPLGELIKSWGRVPFLPGPAPPPALNNPAGQHGSDAAQQEQMKALQQLLVQQQMMQQQFLMRQLQMQQIQQVMQQLQDNEQFKNLPPLQQQQLAMQLMMKQSPVPVISQSQMQKISPSRSPPLTDSLPGISSTHPNHPAFNRSVSQPNTSTEEVSIWDTTTKQNMAGWTQPNSVWDIDPKAAITNTELEMQLERARKEKEEQLERIRKEKEEEERRIQEELKRQHEEMFKQQEELRRQKEEMERQKLEIEKQRQLELQNLEEVMRRKFEEEERLKKQVEEEERRRREEEIRKEREKQQKQEEEMKRREENARREDEMRQQRQRQMMEQQQKQMLEQQQKQQLAEQQQKQMMEQKQREEQQKQQEMQRRQQEEMRQQELQKQRQQQEALKKLQQEQLANIQLPQHAQWGSQQGGGGGSEQEKAKSLLEIQEQEERERQRQEETHNKHVTQQINNRNEAESDAQRLMEAQRQQLMAIQQQQQQQKSWSGQIFPGQQSSRSLIEIQEEQARQLELERQRKQQQQQTQAKALSISAASAWSGANSSSHWASEGAWGNQARSQNGSGSLGFWDDAIISSKRAPAPTNKNMQGNPTEFPALKGGNPMNTPSVPVSKTQKPSKMKKEEEAVHRLFKQPKPQENDFSQWCERALKSLDTSVDIPTFVAFLTEVESPYEVHDYVRYYLGESKASKDFGKQFLEKRSQSRNKAKQPVVEESIWGPAPARDYRQQTNQTSDEFQKIKGGKKKKKMMKIDSSILGFTVSADPERKNVGEMEEDGK